MRAELIETKAAFARRLNVSPGYISNLIRKGMPVSPEGQVRIDVALQWVRENLHAKPGRPPGAAEGGGEADDLTGAKIRLTVAQAERAEIEVAVRRGELIPLEDVKRAKSAAGRATRDMFLNFASRHGAEMAGELGVDTGTFIGLLESHIRLALNEAADQPMPEVGDDD